MNSNEICKHQGVAPTRILENLHEDQSGEGRHRCATCACEKGFNVGSSNEWETYEEYYKQFKEDDLSKCNLGFTAPTKDIIDLEMSQGKTGRHKCVICSFKKGFEDALSLFDNNLEPVLTIVDAPKKTKNPNLSKPNLIRKDFIQIEIENKKLGNIGELFILKYEKQKLKNKNLHDLAKKVKHISKEEGDGAGYDILSYNADGTEKKIEVKTTRGDINRPFYITRNELETSKSEKNHFYLYRVFDFDPVKNKGKCYIINGNLHDSLTLQSIVYEAAPKNIKRVLALSPNAISPK